MISRCTVVLALALTTSWGCAGTAEIQRPDPSPEAVAAPATPPAAVVFGIWAEGQDRLLLDPDGTYLWETEQPCDIPPCPIDQSSGSFVIEGMSLRLTTVTGPDLVLPVTVASDPRRLSLEHPDGRSWTLSFVEERDTRHATP